MVYEFAFLRLSVLEEEDDDNDDEKRK